MAVWILRARPSNSINYWFAAYSFSLAGWTTGLAVLHAGIAIELAARLTFAAASFIPASFLAFTTVYPTLSRWPPRRVIGVAIFVSVGFALLSLTTPLLVYDPVLTPNGFSRKSGSLYPLFAVYFLSAWLTALGIFIAKWRNSRGHARAQLQYLGIGLIISGVGGISANLLLPLLLDVAVYTWLGPFFTVPLVVLVGHAIIRHRLMDLRLVLHRGIAYTAIIGFVTLLAVIGVRRLATDAAHATPAYWIAAFAILAMLSPPVQRPLGRLIDRYLYRGRLDHASILSSATRRLTHLMQPSEVAAQLQTILSEALVPESYVMVLRSFGAQASETLLSDNPEVIDLLKFSTEINDFIRHQPSPSLLLVSSMAIEAETRAAHKQLRDAGAEVLITLGRRGDVLGTVVLGPRRSGEAYFDADLRLLESLSELASIALENAVLYWQRLQIERNQRRVEHLAMMARFYTGIAHEIRSPLASISNFIAMLPDRFDDPEYRDTAVRLLPVEVARITRLADRLRLMAPSEGGKLTLVDICSLLTDIVAIHSTTAEAKRVAITLNCPRQLPRILGDQGQLVQLFVNLVNNAIEAMPGGGCLAIEATQNPLRGPVCVTIIDDGIGIDPAIVPKVFEPFFTTKHSGTGLGLPICREIAEFHHAALSLSPRTDSKGTVASVDFPLPRTDGESERKPERQ